MEKERGRKTSHLERKKAGSLPMFWFLEEPNALVLRVLRRRRQVRARRGAWGITNPPCQFSFFSTALSYCPSSSDGRWSSGERESE